MRSRFQSLTELLKEKHKVGDGIIALLKEAEQKLQQKQMDNANRDRAIAITSLQTAMLWVEKSERPNPPTT